VPPSRALTLIDYLVILSLFEGKKKPYSILLKKGTINYSTLEKDRQGGGTLVVVAIHAGANGPDGGSLRGTHFCTDFAVRGRGEAVLANFPGKDFSHKLAEDVNRKKRVSRNSSIKKIPSEGEEKSAWRKR